MEATFIRRKPGTRDFHPTETAHVGASIRFARPWATPMFKLDHFFGGVFNEVLHHVLLTQPVTA